MRRKISVISVLMLMMLAIIGCGKKEEVISMPSPSLSDIINEEMVSDDECPEGYVYDYQVSMEPIPEEIAALGGDVCGTIHAYPTRIESELVKQEIESNIELKEENEIYLAKVKQYIAETYAGEFEIEPIAINSWRYVCREKETDKSFVLFINPIYSRYKADVEIINVDTYFYEENASVYKETLKNITESTFKRNYVYRVFQEKIGEYRNLQIHIAVFTEKEPVLIEEQKKIIDMYEQICEMREDNDSENVEVIITYFPSKYKEVIMAQYSSSLVDDILGIRYKRADKLIKEGEVYAQFVYDEGSNEEDETSLNKIVTEGKDSYDNGTVLPYWR